MTHGGGASTSPHPRRDIRGCGIEGRASWEFPFHPALEAHLRAAALHHPDIDEMRPADGYHELP